MFSLLTPEQKQMGRRAFLQAAASLPAVNLAAQVSNRSDPVRIGVIGTGDQGQVLLEQCNPKSLRIQAVCDIRPANRARGLKIAQSMNPEAKSYIDFHEMLENEDLQAVIIATPLWMHAPISLAALHAGKHVFCEKAMARTLEECKDMLRVSRQKNLVLQIGHQRYYNPVYHQAYRMILEGVIGEVYHVRSLWHRHSDWRRQPQAEDIQAVELGRLNPKDFGYNNLDHLVNWRLYNGYSGGLSTELMSHQISVTNWIFDSLPERVTAVGDTYCYRDGREIPDHLYAIFEYPQGRVVTYSSIQSNGFDHFYEQFMGTQGTLLLSGEVESYLFWNPEKMPAQESAITQVDVSQENPAGSHMAASASRARDAASATIAREQEEMGFGVLIPYRTELEGFANSIRMGAPVLCGGQQGLEAAVSCLVCNQAIETGQKQNIDPEMLTL